jgi:hypothetical protein
MLTEKEANMRSFCLKNLLVASSGIILLILLVTNCAQIPSPPKSAETLSAELLSIETRPGVTQEFILMSPSNPVATAILLGGYGTYQMKSSFGNPTVTGKSRVGFLIRSREGFAKQGLMVAVLNAPSDQRTEPMMPGFRLTDEHVQDIKALVSYLRKEANIPLWLVGICKGCFSAISGCIQIREGIDGIVLASCITVRGEHLGIPPAYPNGILSMDLDRITVPVLIVYHEGDRCSGTPPSNAPQIKGVLVNSPRAEVKYFTGGKKPVTGPCQALARHGFYGIEDQVVSAIAEFIKTNSK